MICPNCKNQIPDGIQFCPYCGIEISEIKETEPETAQELDDQQEDYPVQQEESIYDVDYHAQAVQEVQEDAENQIQNEEMTESSPDLEGADEPDPQDDPEKNAYDNLTEDEKKKILDDMNGSGYAESMYAVQKPVPGKLPETTYVKILKGFAALAATFAVALVALYFI